MNNKILNGNFTETDTTLDGVKLNIYGGRKELKGEFREINIENLTKNPKKYFEYRLRSFVHPDNYYKQKYENIFILKLDSGEKIYCGRELKHFEEDNEPDDIEEYIYTYEESKDGEKIGHGDIARNINEGFHYLKFIKTEESFQKQGYGERRMFFLNYLSKRYFQKKLDTSTLIVGGSEGFYEKLVQKKYADKKFDKDTECYRYIMKDANTKFDSTRINEKVVDLLK